MTGFPWVLLIVGLLAVAFCLLREHGYLELGRFPSDLGGWATMVNKDQTKGWRAQFDRYSLESWKPKLRYYPQFLDWPRSLRLVVLKHFTVILYLGSKPRPETDRK